MFNVSAGDREWVNRQCTMQPIATFQQVFKLIGNGDPVKRVTFILATDFPDSPFPAFYERREGKRLENANYAVRSRRDAGSARRTDRGPS